MNYAEIIRMLFHVQPRVSMSNTFLNYIRNAFEVQVERQVINIKKLHVCIAIYLNRGRV